MKDYRKVVGPGGDRVHSKPCSRCKEVKEWTKYHSDQSKDDGLSSQCKKCRQFLQWLRRELDTQVPEIAQIIELLLDEWQNAESKLPKLGFCFLMFDVSEEGVLAYVADVERQGMIKTLQEFLEHLKKEETNAVDS